jgi:hypothetical protein
MLSKRGLKYEGLDPTSLADGPRKRMMSSAKEKSGVAKHKRPD